jgi:hypothetical protein
MGSETRTGPGPAGNLAASSLSGWKRRACECTAAPHHRRSCVVAAASWNGSPCVVTTVGRRGRCHNRRVLWNSHAQTPRRWFSPFESEANRQASSSARARPHAAPRLPGTPGHVGRALEPTTRAARDGGGRARRAGGARGVFFSLSPHAIEGTVYSMQHHVQPPNDTTKTI